MNAAPRCDDDDDDDDDVVIIDLRLLLQWSNAHDCEGDVDVDLGDEVNALPPEERSRSESNAAVVVVA